MELKIKWAKIVVGGTVEKYTQGFDTDNMGFDRGHGSFLVEHRDKSVTSYWNCPVVMHQELVPDASNTNDFDRGWEK